MSYDNLNSPATSSDAGEEMEMLRLDAIVRTEIGETVTREDIESVTAYAPNVTPSFEIAFRAPRVLLQSFTGVPARVDLASRAS